MGWVARGLPCPTCAHDHTWLPCDWCPCPMAVVLGVYPAPNAGQFPGHPALESPMLTPKDETGHWASDLRKHPQTPASNPTLRPPGSDF